MSKSRNGGGQRRPRSRSGPSGPTLTADERRAAGRPIVSVTLESDDLKLLNQLAERYPSAGRPNRSRAVAEGIRELARREGLL